MTDKPTWAGWIEDPARPHLVRRVECRECHAASVLEDPPVWPEEAGGAWEAIDHHEDCSHYTEPSLREEAERLFGEEYYVESLEWASGGGQSRAVHTVERLADGVVVRDVLQPEGDGFELSRRVAVVERVAGVVCRSCGERSPRVGARHCRSCGEPLSERVPPGHPSSPPAPETPDEDAPRRSVVDGDCLGCGKDRDDAETVHPVARGGYSLGPDWYCGDCVGDE